MEKEEKEEVEEEEEDRKVIPTLGEHLAFHTTVAEVEWTQRLEPGPRACMKDTDTWDS